MKSQLLPALTAGYLALAISQAVAETAPPAAEVASSVTRVVSGKTITILRTNPSTATGETPMPQARTAAAELAPSEPEAAQAAAKDIVVIATVYPNGVSRLAWYDTLGNSYEALVGWDANLMTVAGVFSDNGIDCSVLPIIATTDATPADALQVQPGSVVQVGEVPAGENAATILSSFVSGQLQPLTAALDERAANPPPEKPPVTAVTIWLKPGKGSRYTKQAEAAQEGGAK